LASSLNAFLTSFKCLELASAYDFTGGRCFERLSFGMLRIDFGGCIERGPGPCESTENGLNFTTSPPGRAMRAGVRPPIVRLRMMRWDIY
jgi:hypothetical protein